MGQILNWTQNSTSSYLALTAENIVDTVFNKASAFNNDRHKIIIVYGSCFKRSSYSKMPDCSKQLSRPHTQTGPTYVRTARTALDILRFEGVLPPLSDMATTASSLRIARAMRNLLRPSICSRCLKHRRALATAVAHAEQLDAASDLESTSLLPTTSDHLAVNNFDPLKASRSRRTQLPPSRCVVEASELVLQAHISS